MGAAAAISVLVDASIAMFNAKMGKAAMTTKKFGGAISRATSVIPGFAGGIGLIGAASAAFKLGRVVNEVDQAMHSSLAIMGPAAQEMKGVMTQAAIDVAKTTKFSTKEAAEAYYFLASAGMNAADSLKAMPTVAAFGQAGMFSLSKATDLLTDSQMAMGMSSKDAERNLNSLTHVGDVLVKANTIANASVEQFSEALTNKGAAAGRRFGQSIEQVTAVMAAFAARGTKGAEAGTQYDIMLRTLSIKAVENAKAFEEAGVKVFDAGGKMRFMGDIVRDLETSMRGLSDETKVEALMAMGFTAKTISSTAALMGASDEMDVYLGKLNEAGGTMQDVADNQLTEFSKGWEQLKASIVEAGTDGISVLDKLGKALAALGDTIDGLSNYNLFDEIKNPASLLAPALKMTGPVGWAAAEMIGDTKFTGRHEKGLRKDPKWAERHDAFERETGGGTDEQFWAWEKGRLDAVDKVAQAERDEGKKTVATLLAEKEEALKKESEIQKAFDKEQSAIQKALAKEAKLRADIDAREAKANQLELATNRLDAMFATPEKIGALTRNSAEARSAIIGNDRERQKAERDVLRNRLLREIKTAIDKGEDPQVLNLN